MFQPPIDPPSVQPDVVSPTAPPPRPTGGRAGLRMQLGIRRGLQAAFAAAAGVAVVISLIAFVALHQVGRALEDIAERSAPLALAALQLGRQADALSAGAGPLAAAVDAQTREAVRRRIRFGVDRLTEALETLKKLGGPTSSDQILPLVRRLTDNLAELDALVTERETLTRRKTAARRDLTVNLQVFQSQLAYRLRILEGDAAVLRRQLAGDGEETLSPQALLNAAAQMPAAKLYADVEAINSRILAAGEEPNVAEIDMALTGIGLKLEGIEQTFQNVEPATAATLTAAMETLRRLALGESGLPALRRRELRLAADVRRLLTENTAQTQSVNRAVTELTAESRAAVDQAAADARRTRNLSETALLSAVVALLGGIAVLLRFYVGRHLIRRLTRISDAMLNIAAGRFNAPLPPEGADELGRLGTALRRFRDVAADAERRENELREANAKAHEALQALETAQQVLIRQTRTDFLTGVANRQYFMERAERAWTRAQRENADLSILMVDVDHFKRVNDTWGHIIGDEALQTFVKVCDGALRPSDLLGRLGGEEFAVLLPGADLNGALEAAERLRAAVAAADVRAGEATFRITVSIGAAWIGGGGIGGGGIGGGRRSLDAALAAADAALYAAKQGGRNRVVGDDAAA